MTTTAAHQRTTRRVHNQRPIVLNPLRTFTCQRGILCRLPIDDNTFMDPEDGQTSRMTLSVHAIGNHSNFLVVVPGNQLEGVPVLDEGDSFSFRLEARDRKNAVSFVFKSCKLRSENMFIILKFYRQIPRPSKCL